MEKRRGEMKRKDGRTEGGRRDVKCSWRWILFGEIETCRLKAPRASSTK